MTILEITSRPFLKSYFYGQLLFVLNVEFIEIEEMRREEKMRDRQKEGDRKLPPQREWQKEREKGDREEKKKQKKACLLFQRSSGKERFGQLCIIAKQ